MSKDKQRKTLKISSEEMFRRQVATKKKSKETKISGMNCLQNIGTKLLKRTRRENERENFKSNKFRFLFPNSEIINWKVIIRFTSVMFPKVLLLSNCFVLSLSFGSIRKNYPFSYLLLNLIVFGRGNIKLLKHLFDLDSNHKKSSQ